MKHIALLPVLSIALLASFAVHAADTADLKVTGEIVPAACRPNFSGGGVVDFGKIRRSTLSPTNMTAMTAKTVSFTLDCEANTRMGIKLTDNKSSSVVAGAVNKINGSLDDTAAFGLDLFEGKKLGAYAVNLGNIRGDGSTPDYVYFRTNSTDSWGYTLNNGSGSYFKKDTKTWGVGNYSPHAYTVVTGDLRIQAVLESTANLPAGDAVPLNGSATMEIVYL